VSGPRDLELATTLYRNLVNEVDEFASLGEDLLGWFVYLQGAILQGGWVDLDIGASATGEAFYEFISSLPCSELFTPYFEPRPWTEEEITALKVSHRLKK
jgi:hypothetical protein